MAISDSDFTLWNLQTGTKRTVLAEMKYAYESAGNLAAGTVYLGNRTYVTEASETPASQIYRDALTGSFGYTRAIDIGTLGGRSTFSVTDLKLSNADGALDFLEDLVVDGQEIKFYLGDASWPRSDFRLVLSAQIERVVTEDRTERELTVKLRDKRLLLDREVKGDAVGGTGPNATKYLPLLWGSHENLEPLIYDTTTLEYAVVSNYSAQSIVADVRDNGLSLRSGGWSANSGNTTVNAGTDTFTKTAHGLAVDDVIFFADPALIASGSYSGFYPPFAGMGFRAYWVKTVPTADTFTLSATKGGATLDVTGTTWGSPSGPGGSLTVIRQRWFDDVKNTGLIRLSSKAVGSVTLDITNQGDGWGPFQIASDLILAYGNVTSSDLDTVAFSLAGIALSSKVSLPYYKLAVLQRRNLIDVLDEIMSSSFGWFGIDNLGVITCGLLDPAGLAAATATRTLTAAEVTDGVSCENRPVTLGRINVNYAPIILVQSADGLATTITDAARARYTQPFRAIQRSTAPSGTTYAGNKPLYHKTMVEAEPRALPISDTAWETNVAKTVGAFADEIVKDRRPHLRALRCASSIDKYAWKLGEVVSFTYPRHGLSSGKNCRLTSISVDLLQDVTQLELLTYVAPNTTTASYP